MKPVEAMVLLMCAVVGVVMLGRRLNVPYPIALVLGGLGISLVPGLPVVRIDPNLVFLLFLPPILYAAAWFTSWHEFKANLRPIVMLAVGLVLFTTVVVGLVVHAVIPDIPLAIAFALGAIVSPPDAVAATAIGRQMGLPKRLLAIIEGESLVNDATGLVALRFALVAAASGTFSLGHASLEFLWVAAGGIALGLVVGIAITHTMCRIKNDYLLITISILAPYIAALPAERFHVSGVLAAVSAGVYGGWKGPELFTASARLNAIAVWNMLIFLLNCVLFILIGLQLPEVIAGLDKYSRSQLLAYGIGISLLVILIRPTWVFPATWIPRWLSRELRKRDPIPPWQHIAVVSWSGMRGVVSLAAALALPAAFSNGTPFPQRDLVVYLTFCVILSTLVVQGLSLPWVIRGLHVHEKHHEEHEREVRSKVAHAALARLDKLAEEKHLNEPALERVKSIYQDRLAHLNDELAETLGWSSDRERIITTRRLWLAALEAERHELLKLRREHHVEEELMHRIMHEMDLEETRLRG